ncbi:MAG: hypothetical protein AB8H80_13140 [Planctomycetota bacterium]
MRKTSYLAALALSVLAPSGGLLAQWAEQTPTLAPGMRRAGAMAFDPATNRLMIYGGIRATPGQILSECWAYNGIWIPVASTAPGRWGHTMVTDTTNSRILTFGGRSPTLGSLANDLQEWDGASWSPIATTSAPSPRFLYGMAYDSNRDVVVLFGGRTATGVNNETWEFDGTDWTQATPGSNPAPREEMGMVFDEQAGTVILFGGCDADTGTVYGDTWTYDGNNWVDASPPTGPSPRFRGAMVYDSDRSRSVYFGGYDNTNTFDETFELLSGQWIEVNATTPPTNVTENYHAYDPQRGVTVVFGGFGSSFNKDTWEYTGDPGGLFSLYGQPCLIGGTDEPSLSGTSPTIGQTLALSIGNLGTSFGVLVTLGLSDQTFNGAPLPLDLGAFGLPGCGLLASADFTDLAPAASGSVNYALAIPFSPSLLFSSVYVQGLTLDATLNLSGATRGGRALIAN